MQNLDDLNPQQRKAVTTPHGPVLLLAGAGSGKTRVIIHRIAHLIQKQQVPPKQILAVTFTNKAAVEMQERLAQMLKGHQKGVQLSTFHSLCVKILRRSIEHLGYRANFTIFDSQDQLSLIKGIMEEEGYDEAGLVEAKTAHWAIGQAKVWRKPPEDFLMQKHALREVLIGQIYQKYQATLKGCNALDFDDLLNLTLTLMEEHATKIQPLYDRYRYILVDEYQDTNRSQYLLLKHLAKRHRNLCVVGDDDQSIYGWRGADLNNILDFEQDYPEAQVIKLEQNYRSTQTILTAANQVIEKNPERMPKNLWSQQGEGQTIGWLVGDNELEESKKVVECLQLQVLRSKRKHHDYAILYRSNFQSRVIEEALREAAIPYEVVGGMSFYERKEIKDALAYLRVIHNEKDEVNLHRIVNFPRRGIGKTSLIHANDYCHALQLPLFKVMEQATLHGKIPPEAARSMESFTGLIQHYRQRFQTEPLDRVFQALLEEVGFVRALEKEKNPAKTKERKVIFVYELMRALQQYVAQQPEKKLQDYLERITLINRDHDSEDGKNRVTLMTLHSAKGLEFPYVFMVGMAEGIFPNKRALEEGSEHEERRLCYVGITRAKKELTFSMPKMRKQYKETLLLEPSRFLEEIKPELFAKPLEGPLSSEEKEAQTQNARTQFFAEMRKRKTLPTA